MGVNMLIKIEKDRRLIDTNALKTINSGVDGTVYSFEGEALKLSDSMYMTREKVKDLRQAVPDNSNCRIVVPRRMVIDPSKNYSLKYKPIIGYTQRLLLENPNGIRFMTPDEYFNEFSIIERQTLDFLSNNQIALMDTNPNNILANWDDDTKLFLIDHDRDITASSTFMEHQKIINSDYLNHNQKKLAVIMYKVILLQLLKIQGIGNSISSNRKVDKYIEQEAQRNDLTFSTTEQALDGYSSIDEYAKDTLKKIKKR